MENIFKALSEYTLFGSGEILFENSKRHKDYAYLIDVIISDGDINLLYAINGELVRESFILSIKQHGRLMKMSSGDNDYSHQDILDKWVMVKGDYKYEFVFEDVLTELMRINGVYVVGCFRHEQTPLHNLFYYMETQFNICSINVVGLNSDVSRLLYLVNDDTNEENRDSSNQTGYDEFEGFWKTLKKKVLKL